MSLRRFTPKQFLCRYPLSRGVLVYAIILLIEAIVCIIVLAVQMISFNSCTRTEENASCLEKLVKNSFAFNGTAMIYCIVLLIFQVWVIWAVKKGKASIVLLWVVVTCIWLIQLLCMFLVLLIMYINDTSVIAWSLCAVFGCIGFCLAAYGIAVGLGLWLEMKAPAGAASA